MQYEDYPQPTEDFLAPKYNAIDVNEFIQLNIPPREHILAPWLPRQGLAMVYAPRGVGKTYVALSIAQAVVSGSNFLNWEAPEPRGVLYIDGEMPATVMQERLKAFSNEEEIRAPFRLITPDMQNGAMPDLSKLEDQVQLNELLNDIELIIVDNISTLCRSSKENDADAWIPVQDWALQMRSSGRSVLFIHHAGKGGAQRGTSKREDVLDTVISLKQSEDYNASEGAAFEVHFKKARGFYGSDAEPLKTQLITDENGAIRWQQEPLTASTFDKVLEMTKKGEKQQSIAKKLNINKSNVSRHVQKAKETGKLRSCVA